MSPSWVQGEPQKRAPGRSGNCKATFDEAGMHLVRSSRRHAWTLLGRQNLHVWHQPSVSRSARSMPPGREPCGSRRRRRGLAGAAPGARRSPHDEVPEAFNTALLAFLEEAVLTEGGGARAAAAQLA